MRRTNTRTLCAVGVSLAALMGAVPAMAQTANLTFVSEPGDYVGQGESLAFSDGIDAYGSTDGRIVSVSVNSDGHWFSLNLAAPDGQALAPGVSAPAPLGLPLAHVEALVDQVLASGRVLAADLAELNPLLDEGGRTARVAARLAARIARGFAAH